MTTTMPAAQPQPDVAPSLASQSAKLQKMLDLEHKLKMERFRIPPHAADKQHKPALITMQASSRPTLPSTGPDSMAQSNLPAASACPSQPSRSMTAPQLSTTIPPILPSPRAAATPSPREEAADPHTPPKNATKSVSFLPDEKDDADGSGSDSDSASSICQSPSWEGYGQRKKDKRAEEKQRRKGREKVEKEDRDAKRKPASRLTKPPPSTNRPPGTQSQDKGSHAASRPATQSATQSATQVNVSVQDSNNSQRASTFPVPYPPSASSRPKHARQRSSSVTSQIRAALAGNGGASSRGHDKEAGKEVGFIGGLKLEQQREAARQTSLEAESRSASREQHGDVSHGARNPSKPQKAHSYGLDAESSVLEPVTLPRTASDGPASSSQSPSRRDEGTPSSVRHSSMLDTLVSSVVSSRPKSKVWDLNKEPKSTTREREAGHEGDTSAAESSTEEPTRGRRGWSYVRHHRQQSRDRAISGFRDETRVLAKSRYPPQANRQHHARASSETGNAGPSFTQGPNAATGGSRSGSRAGNSGVDGLDSSVAPPDSVSSPSAVELEANSAKLSSPATSQERRTRSKDKLGRTPSAAAQGIRGAVSAAFQRVRSSSRPPASSSAYFDRHAGDAAAAPHIGQGSGSAPRPASQASIDRPREKGEQRAPKDCASAPTKTQDPVRPSSSSSSYLSESVLSPSSVTTPDSRPQSDKGLPPVVGEVNKGTAGSLVVSNDHRVLRLSQRALLAENSELSNPKSGFFLDGPGMTARGDQDKTSSSKRTAQHATAKGTYEKDRERIAVNLDLDVASIKSFKTCLDPLDAGSSVSSPSSPRNALPTASTEEDVGGAKRAVVIPGEYIEGNAGMAPALALEAASTALTRAPSLSKSRSTPHVVENVDATYHLHQPPPHQAHHHALEPPPKSQARRASIVRTSSISLPDALPYAPHSAPILAATSHGPSLFPPDDSSVHLQAARKAVPRLPATSAAISTPAVRLPRPSGGGTDPMTKMFVECCSCRFLHDMPSRVYECMAHPDAVVEDPRLGVSGVIGTVVKCPWCRHGMTTRCCAGYSAVVYLKERLH